MITFGIPTIMPSITLGAMELGGDVGRDDLYTSMTVRVGFPNVEENEVAITTVTTFTYTIVDNRGAALSPANTGSFTYSATDEKWYATVTLPSVAGRYHLHVAVTKGSSVGFTHETLLVKPRA